MLPSSSQPPGARPSLSSSPAGGLPHVCVGPLQRRHTIILFLLPLTLSHSHNVSLTFYISTSPLRSHSLLFLSFSLSFSLPATTFPPRHYERLPGRKRRWSYLMGSFPSSVRHEESPLARTYLRMTPWCVCLFISAYRIEGFATKL